MSQTIEKEAEISIYLIIHQAIRRNLSLLEQHSREQVAPEISKVQKIAGWWHMLWDIIEHHHLNEDNIAFPDYAKRGPEIAGQLDGLTGDHHVLDDLVIQIGGFLKLAQVPGPNRLEPYRQYIETLAKFNHLMFDHLGREETIVLRAEAVYYTPEQLEALHTSIMKATTMKVMSLEAPFLFYGADPELEKIFMNKVPLFLKVIYKLSWKGKFRRIMAAYQA